jgi:Sugar-transfer associated ATP-grasp
MIALNPVKYLRFAARILKYSRKIKGRTSLSLMQQTLEVYRLLKLNQMEPKEYYETYELFTDDLTWEDKTHYLSRNQFARMDPRLNPRKNVGVVNKLVFYIVARHFDLPVAKMYGLFDPNSGYTADGDSLRTARDLNKLLAILEGNEFLFKPISADRAQGIIVCGHKDGKLVELGEGEIDAETLCKRMCGTHYSGFNYVADSYLVEERIQQHPWYNRYSDTYAHNFRIVTFLTSKGNIECLGGGLALGTTGHYIHQSGRHGISAGIDRDGLLKQGVGIGPEGFEYHDNHPETGERIIGERPPVYKECIELAIKAHSCIPHMRSLGWDLIPTEKGPIILEGNPYWNWEKFQYSNHRGVVRGDFAKDLPKILA